MRVLITGGTGMIGRALATNLLQDNGKNEVIVLSRNPERIRKPQPGVQYLGWDGRTAQGWGDTVENFDAIVNLAGELIGINSQIYSRTGGYRTYALLDAALHLGLDPEAPFGRRSADDARMLRAILLIMANWKSGSVQVDLDDEWKG